MILLPMWLLILLICLGLISIGKDIAFYLVYGEVLPRPRDEQTLEDLKELYRSAQLRDELKQKDLDILQKKYEKLLEIILNRIS